MVGSRTALVKQKASRKGWLIFGAGVGTVGLALLTPWLLLVGIPATAWVTYDWLRYRGKWGLRF